MLNFETAKKMVEEQINASYHVDGDELVVLEEETIQKEYGWIFLYTSRRLIETDDLNYMVGGNAPVVVNKRTGELTFLGTAEPLENYVRRYEQSLMSDSSI